MKKPELTKVVCHLVLMMTVITVLTLVLRWFIAGSIRCPFRYLSGRKV